MIHEAYEIVVGLEVHAQLQTKTKLFCGDSAAFGAAPNTHISPVTLAHPGALPMMNEQAIEYAIKLGLALNCDIVQENYFARKNYFYPDLPKGYQISQHTTPICKNGYVTVGTRNIQLNRIHIEEDAGKSIHDADENYTCVDLNRAGVPLLEIVSEPNIHSADEAFAYLTELRRLVRWIDICDGNMEEGSMRCDANISIRKKGVSQLGTRVEVKNLNSIRNVKKAIEMEAERLIEIVERGGTIIQETRSFDADKQVTFSLRSKEDADDYRYFADPDLAPFQISDETLEAIKVAMPALPEKLVHKFITSYNLTEYDAQFICSDRILVQYFESIIEHTTHYKAAANWIMGPIKSHLNEAGLAIDAFGVKATSIAAMIHLIDTGKINFTNASTKIFHALVENPEQNPLEIATTLNLIQEQDAGSVEAWVDEVLGRLADKVKEYKSGKKGLLGLFAGEVKKLSKGKADMQLVNELLTDKLNS
jgi:aspartyl-tRNA(Asn)/glutamyl-tRNA(Gln) amidotransferase subunit B